MGLGDKISNKAQEVAGKVKEGVGSATDNPDLKAEGHKDQAAAKAKQVGENIKDAAKDLKGE
ncbi:CsbD family protein [Paeniglutamicibacter sp. NPDC012692]|uniref:CsbD family protein n=1 Tax=Paeniglutamicibacter sp. NPDC012692 TaxID=3364388 RepID=UPI003698E836